MEIIAQKFVKYIVCMSGGLLLSFETALLFFVLCLLAIVLDIISTSSRHGCSAGACTAVILADYTDRLVLKDTDVTVRFVVGVFLFYEVWSCLENWSSENDRPLARALQRIMVNKAERHLNVPLEDIFFDEYGEEKDDGKENGNDSQTPNTPKL